MKVLLTVPTFFLKLYLVASSDHNMVRTDANGVHRQEVSITNGKLFGSLFGNALFCSKSSNDLYMTKKVSKAFVWWYKLLHRYDKSGSCESHCSDLCEHQACVTDYQLSSDRSTCTCIRNIVTICDANSRCLDEKCECLDGFVGDGFLCCDTSKGEQFVDAGEGNTTCSLPRKVNVTMSPFPFDPTILQVVDEESGTTVTFIGTKDEYGMVQNVTSMVFSTTNETGDGGHVAGTVYFDEYMRPNHFRDSIGNDVSLMWLSDSVLSVQVASSDGGYHAINEVDANQLNTSLFTAPAPLGSNRTGRWLKQEPVDDNRTFLSATPYSGSLRSLLVGTPDEIDGVRIGYYHLALSRCGNRIKPPNYEYQLQAEYNFIDGSQRIFDIPFQQLDRTNMVAAFPMNLDNDSPKWTTGYKEACKTVATWVGYHCSLFNTISPAAYPGLIAVLCAPIILPTVGVGTLPCIGAMSAYFTSSAILCNTIFNSPEIELNNAAWAACDAIPTYQPKSVKFIELHGTVRYGINQERSLPSSYVRMTPSQEENHVYVVSPIVEKPFIEEIYYEISSGNDIIVGVHYGCAREAEEVIMEVEFLGESRSFYRKQHCDKPLDNGFQYCEMRVSAPSDVCTAQLTLNLVDAGWFYLDIELETTFEFCNNPTRGRQLLPGSLREPSFTCALNECNTERDCGNGTCVAIGTCCDDEQYCDGLCLSKSECCGQMCPDGSCIPFEGECDLRTENQYVYHMWNNMLGGSGCVSFKVKARNDAHIGFFANYEQRHLPDTRTPRFYEVVIGGWYDTRSTVRNGAQGTNQNLNYSSAGWLDDAAYAPFWACARDDTVSMGEGKMVGESTISCYNFSGVGRNVRYVGFSTGFGSSGNWIDIAIENEFAPDICA